MAASSATAFDRHQFDAIYPPGVEAHYWVRARNRLIGGFLAELGLPADEPILEIGCGRGIVVAYLAARGRHIEGVELAPVPPVPEAAARVRSGLGFEALPEADRARYRTLLLLDVIEHIGDRPRFLREILAAFPAARRIVVTVPARQEVWSNYDEFNGHFLRYDIPELERLAAASGLRCAGARYLFHALYWPARLLVLLGRARRTAFPVPRGAMRAVHRLLAAAFVLEARLLPRRLVGTSLMAVLERE